MSLVQSQASAGEPRERPGLALINGLSLAATPTFAAMALFTGVMGGGSPICSGMGDTMPLNGMVPMYLLMAVFHSAAWVRLISRRVSA